MKKIVLFTLLVLWMLSLCGCGLFMTRGQYDSGASITPAGSQEWARIKQDQLAYEKLKNVTPKTGEGEKNGYDGYEGVVANFSNYYRYNFVVYGPEVKSWLLGPGDRIKDSLIPGKYVRCIFKGDQKLGCQTFSVSPQKHSFFKEDYHWYIYAEW